MATPKEIKLQRKENFLASALAFFLAMINMVLCWLNFTITRLAGITVVNFYSYLIYPELQAKQETTRIGGINQLSDLVTLVITVILCMVFILWVWHRYETAKKKKGSLMREFITYTGWQMLEVALAGLVILLFNYLLLSGEIKLLEAALSQYSQEILTSMICLILGVIFVIGGNVLGKRTRLS
ncbi:MAG: hypothetical protein ACOX6S_04940 [Clostridia bacterium]